MPVQSYMMFWLLIFLLFTPLVKAAKSEVNVYSARKEALIKPVLDQFTEQSGIKVNLVTGKGDALLVRLQAEGVNSPADLLITTDVGRLYRAKAAGVLQPVDHPSLKQIITPEYRDTEDYWFGLSLRSRVIVYAPERIKASELSSYEALADKQWRGRICIRSSDNVYNQSLVASLIAHHGPESTNAWLKQFVANFARPPRGGDRDQIRAVASGQCDLAVVNSYYMGAMTQSKDKQDSLAAHTVKLFWPNQADRGVHMNISGAAVTAAAPNKDEAIRLIAFLLSEQSQQWYARVNNEYPVRKDVAISETLKNWGTFKADQLPVAKLGQLNADAVKAMDRAGWK